MGGGGLVGFADRSGGKRIRGGEGKGETHRAAACAARKEPVVLISSRLFHSAGDMSIACVHPTTPAKQHSTSTLRRCDTVSLTADSNCSAFVTSTFIDKTFACGKSAFSASISRVDFEWSRSKSARPERPCSSKARAFTRARVPAPPVTGKRQYQRCGLERRRGK